MSSIAAIQKLKKVDAVEDHRSDPSGGVWAFLKPGFCGDQQAIHVLYEEMGGLPQGQEVRLPACHLELAGEVDTALVPTEPEVDLEEWDEPHPMAMLTPERLPV